ncbi:hypothetical protein M427DRAFT_140090 [Gonapodya prolifera JEL478]|uniref:Uncharacterized protein n=1 Tax=Gonapodya prolifera (strain JEL478) TaxID=1344416 RepID=A0A138ZZX5_GONPJ|nr:hypothetical protein M427DRAFT_140090 [Gonapodya prolifera JEL478]|eukprot:KXS10022.1 hypothetical protein M427DRAFT_140090 [Gonapodya prolifera JEL478]
MDEPLFGDVSRRDQQTENIVSAVVIGFVALTVIFSWVNTYKGAANFFFGAGLIVLLLCEVQLVRWYRLGDLDPKFKWLILALGVSVVFFSILANVYFWAAIVTPESHPALAKCIGGNTPDINGHLGLFRSSDDTCWYVCDSGFLLDLSKPAPGVCVRFG